MRSTGKQEEKDEINFQIQTLGGLATFIKIHFTKNETQRLKQIFKVINLHSFLFLNFLLAFNSFFKKLVLQ